MGRSQTWDANNQWQLKPKKSNVFAVGLVAPNLTSEAIELPITSLVRYLGVEVPFKYNLPRQLLHIRYRKAADTLKRISQLPKFFPIEVRARAIETAALPKWAYAISCIPAPQQVLQKLAVEARFGLTGRPRMPLECVLPWCFVPIASLPGEQSGLVDAVRDSEPRVRPRGPIQVTISHLAMCSFSHEGG